MRKLLFIPLVFISLSSFCQDRSIETFLSDSAMMHASVSLAITDVVNGEVIMEHNSWKSLVPASVMKLLTSASALELLGPKYTFRTVVGYTGSLNRQLGKLKGDIVIKGGGDPTLGSKYFKDHYRDFIGKWVKEIKKAGIRKIEGRIITDDSYYDYQPVPAKWSWEDIGNYYGAGVYGLSVFDNTYEIHLKTSSNSSGIVIGEVVPPECKNELSNWLVASGDTDDGSVFAAPYSTNGWIAGSISVNTGDSVLKASITDPPLLIAKILKQRLEAEGITISGDPTTIRLEHIPLPAEVVPITETISPSLVDIIEVLNHESINLYAEHLIKELGKVYKNIGSTSAGIDVVRNFLIDAGIQTEGMFIEDGSGLSPLNSINAGELVNLLIYMKNGGKYFSEYFSSLPDAGEEGTLKNCFTDAVFNSKLRAKSGSMTRVKSYAGYFVTISNRKMAFCIIINNYTGTSEKLIPAIEEILRNIILYK